MDSAEQKIKENDNDNDSSNRNLVVGIGASAGGLRPLEKLFSLLPSDTGCSFVVIQHLSPDFDSVMDTLLSRQTEMPIRIIEAGMAMQPNTVYLNPPRMNAEIHGGQFVLSPFEKASLRLPINVFFESIAREYGPNSVAVVLSGTGSDGALGMKSVHQWSGLTLVQSVDSSEFDGMPKNAIATGEADYELNPAAIAELICQHVAGAVQENDGSSSKDPNRDLVGMNEIQVIFSLLAKEHGIDFSHYKPGTVARRIDRRLQLSRFGGLSQYVEILKSEPDELSRLYHDLLIGVTSFFRDPASFSSLRIELMSAVEAASNDEPMRVWCAGCASGEEAYSLAILIYEMFDDLGRLPHFKVFATDVHDRTLDVATRAVYPAESLTPLTQKQRDRFFASSEDGQCRVLPRLRNHLVFAKQNVVSDPPFTNMDLVICRNLLIYLQDDAQAAAISGFRYAMKDEGLLMLGPSETLGRLAEGFVVLDKTWRLFRKQDHPFEKSETDSPLKNLGVAKPESRTFQMVEAQSRSHRIPEVSYRLLADYLPSALLLDSSYCILEAFGTAGEYLKTSPGKVGGDVMSYFDDTTRSALYAILVQAEAEIGRICAAKNVRLTTKSGTRIADVFVKAFSISVDQKTVLLLRFQEPFAINGAERAEPAESYIASSDTVLQEELDRVRLTLGSSIQDLEFSNQELQAANEEMIASNEELQATNEELQSVNEELHSVNVEHQRKVQELEEMTHDFNNLFDSSNVGLILLDDELRIRKFTTAASRYFNLMQHDVGRQLNNFASRILLDDFFDRIHQVMQTGERFNTRARDKDGTLVSVDIIPYRANNLINGVIVNMTEVLIAQEKDIE
ncbi:Chemotaxis protein methyltransferase [Rubripirellula obstinata]|uniref:Chemotaxis protein methyltransferase n=1 Tax=Rubripirellula obstinata TaxID=406547 RepID=A0A5B1CLM3_9BACT|nr:chemotaxis protein CheB [Rubripirellula obstinata]KAA1262107.1 Chemotaxis protein methyltransferase [Rubripirellula obstinata]